LVVAGYLEPLDPRVEFPPRQLLQVPVADVVREALPPLVLGRIGGRRRRRPRQLDVARPVVRAADGHPRGRADRTVEEPARHHLVVRRRRRRGHVPAQPLARRSTGSPSTDTRTSPTVTGSPGAPTFTILAPPPPTR